jgi:hypothetical protein
MNDEQRLQMVTDQLILVRDNLFRGMSKSIQKLQARSINEVLGLETFIGQATPPAAKRQWVGLTDEEIEQGCKESWVTEQAFQSAVWWAEAKLKEKNT